MDNGQGLGVLVRSVTGGKLLALVNLRCQFWEFLMKAITGCWGGWSCWAFSVGRPLLRYCINILVLGHLEYLVSNEG